MNLRVKTSDEKTRADDANTARDENNEWQPRKMLSHEN